MNTIQSPEFWSIVGSFVSVLLGFLAIALSVYFFVKGKDTERLVSNSLTKIETQANALQKISGKQLDKLTEYVTQPQKGPIQESESEIVKILKELPNSLGLLREGNTDTRTTDQLEKELALAYGALYFYIGQANFWSQLNLPAADEYDEEQALQSEAKTVVDLSAQDFNVVANILPTLKISEIEGSNIEPLVERTKEFWRTLVRNSSGVFLLREEQKKGQS